MSRHNLVVGDIQGCLPELQALMAKAAFDPDQDHLWLLGDLVNRGSDSLGTLRWIRQLERDAGCISVVLGNHDLHLLAIHFGGHRPSRKDTFDEILAAPDRDEICEWLRRQPLMHWLPEFECALVHAGIPHLWDVSTAQSMAAEVEAVMRGPEHVEFFERMYGNRPDCFAPGLVGMDRWRVITNYFTRMRLIRADGTMEFAHKGTPDDVPSEFAPWYEYPAKRLPAQVRVLFGHWAALDGITNAEHAVALDTGCVWGRTLTALRLEDGVRFAVPAVGPPSSD